MFDRDIRKNNFVDTDFYQRNIDKPIEIMTSIDISDVTDSDSEKLRAKVKGALLSNQNIVYIKLIAEYDRTELTANTVLYWGGDTSDLQEIKSKGYFFEIDQVFNVIVADDPIFYQSFVHYTPVYSLSAATTAEVHIKSAVTAKFILQELDCDDAIFNVLSQVAKQSRKSSLQKVSNNNGQKCTDIQL